MKLRRWDVGLLFAVVVRRTVTVEVSAMRYRVFIAVLLVGSVVACGSSSDTTSGTDSTPGTSTTLTTDSPRGTDPTTTPTSSTTTTPPVTTDVPTTAPPTVTLEAILEPYEAAAVEGHGLSSMTFDACYRNGWGSNQVDTTWPAARGDVLICGGQPEPPRELGSLIVVVLDNAGTTASLWETVDSGEVLALWSSGEQSLPFDAASGQLCREFLANPVLAGWLTSPFHVERGYPRNAYVLVLAYWFLEGQPTQMDVDGNGIPCENLFPPDVVADVWAGDF